MGKALDIKGSKYGRLLVVDFGGTRRTTGGKSVRQWNCVCECGNTCTVDTLAITSGNTKSCGCLGKEVRTPHGMYKDRFYRIWVDMKTRCDNEVSPSYRNYGGRGIKYQDDWKLFENFLKDMWEGYSEDLTLERIDVNGDYCTVNCKWASKSEQARNKGMLSSNKTGITGVRIWKDKSGEVEYYVAEAQTPNGEKRYSKYFSTTRYGKDKAFKLAKESREKFMRLLASEGYIYGENHGK